MHYTIRRWSLLLALPCTLAACERAKSANPLSPNIAGPMGGVTLSVPKQIEPGNGGTIQDKDQPVSLLIENPATNSPRPVTMRVQIAVDAGFANIVYTRDGLTFGESGRTIHRLPDRLQSGWTYYWRVGAGDGANETGWSAPTRFEVLNPIVIGVPDPRSPVANSRTDNMTPELIVANGQSSGPYASLSYNYQIADNVLFAPLITNADVPEAAGGVTKYVPPTLPAYDKTFYWRVRVTDGTNTGAWSTTATFRSPSAPLPPPAPGPSPLPTGNWQSCGSLAADKLALVQCVHAAVKPGFGEAQAFEVTKRVAWLLRGEGAGLLIKNGGENIVSWMGYSFAAGRICYPDGHIFKVLTDVGGGNGPGWADNDFVDRSLYVPAINPG